MGQDPAPSKPRLFGDVSSDVTSRVQSDGCRCVGGGEGGVKRVRLARKTSDTGQKMPMLKRPAHVAAFQSPRPCAASPIQPTDCTPPPGSDSASQDLSRGEVAPVFSTPISVAKPSFSLHKNYTPPTNVKPVPPLVAAEGSSHAVVKAPHPSSLVPSALNSKRIAGFTPPQQSDLISLSSKPSVVPAAPAAPERVFACMFTKVSKKKHKTWSDGFVVFNLGAKKLILKDTEGKDIGKMGWQSPSFTNDLKSGCVMNYVCGYDLELCQEIELSQYTSGQCFLSKSKKPSSVCSIAVVSGLKATPFLAHSDTASSFRKAPVPLHSPDEPGAVVLVTGNAARGTVAIVLEPRLASLLRPHQLDGVTFCVTCLLGGEPERVSDGDCRRQFAPGHLPEGRALAAFQGGAILADDMGLGFAFSLSLSPSNAFPHGILQH
jgi:hypothetical protein